MTINNLKPVLCKNPEGILQLMLPADEVAAAFKSFWLAAQNYTACEIDGWMIDAKDAAKVKSDYVSQLKAIVKIKRLAK